MRGRHDRLTLSIANRSRAMSRDLQRRLYGQRARAARAAA
jgi:hypothetical protein